MIIDEYHPEIKNYAISKCLQLGDPVTLDGNQAIFDSLPFTYFGRLEAPGLPPGKYRDRSRAVLKIADKLETHPIFAISLDPKLLEQRLAALPPDWNLMNLSGDKVGELPETPFMEGDIVSVIDAEHEHYHANPNNNQFTLNRIKYEKEPIGYKLRRGPLVFEVVESQIKKCGDGPVRLFYGGENYKLRWPDIKDEAEFYLLLGRYNRVYNSANKSYYWEPEAAKQAIILGAANAILKTNDGLSLVTFWDSDIGHQMMYYPDMILDI